MDTEETIMDKIKFDDKTKANIVELYRLIKENQERVRIICQTVVYMNDENPDYWTLAPDLSGVVRLPEKKEEEVNGVEAEND